MFLRLLAYLERKRNCLLWDIFDYFFYHDYEYLNLQDRFIKYNTLLERKELETPEYLEQLRLEELELEKREYARKHVELDGTDEIAKEFLVFDLDREIYIDNCTYANQTTGEYKLFISGRRIQSLRYKGQSNIVIVWKGEE